MKKNLLLIVTALFAITITTSAQPQMPSAEEMANNETKLMKSRLNLTEEQLSTVKKINLKYAEKMNKMFQENGGPGGNFSEMEKKMKEIETQKRDELATVLDDKQLKEYDEMVAERHKNRQGGPPRH